MDTDRLQKLSARIQEVVGNNRELSEEQIKNSIILPFFMAMDYDVFSLDEFIPQYFVEELNIKSDYGIFINKRLVGFINISQDSENTNYVDFNKLSNTDILFCAIIHKNEFVFVSNREYYADSLITYRLKVNELGKVEYGFLEKYSRHNVKNLHVNKHEQRFKDTVSNFLNKLSTGDIDNKFLVYLAEQSGALALSNTELLKIFIDELNKFKEIKVETSKKSQIDQEKEDLLREIINKSAKDINYNSVKSLKSGSENTEEKNKVIKVHNHAVGDITKIKYNELEQEVPRGIPIVYNEYDLKSKKPCRFFIQDLEMRVYSFTDILLEYTSYALKTYSEDENYIIEALNSPPFGLKITKVIKGVKSGFRGIPNTNYCMYMYYSTDKIIKVMEKITKLLCLSDEDIKITLL